MARLVHSCGDRRHLRGVVGALLAAATLSAATMLVTSLDNAAANSPTYRLLSQTSAALKSTLIKEFLTAEKKSHTLSAAANVNLVHCYDFVGSDGKTHAGPVLLNPLVVSGPGHASWAYAFFYPSIHSSLHDQVALQDGNGVAIFEASPAWRVLKIGGGYPTCVKSVLDKVVPAPVASLWLAQGCQ